MQTFAPAPATVGSAAVIEGDETEVVGYCVAAASGRACYEGSMALEIFGSGHGSGEGVHRLDR